ncbi:hypothetical protein [Variovorax sp. Root318D1]|uniref:hypothetical protein n=1 Tax=Variovorax sp. Root318D1 TaxID=1736513 RepID=UPI0012FA1731|nr:hypothetical protein [Variovorax sp. Root318D1]
MTIEELLNLKFNGCDLDLHWGHDHLSIIPVEVECAAQRISALSFEAVRDTWAVLWEDLAQQWSNRLDLLPNDRCRVSGIDAKSVYDKIKVSFACEHPDGLLRWGFTTAGVTRDV